MIDRISPSSPAAPTGGRHWPLACRQWQGARPYQEDAFATVEIDPPDSGEVRALLLLLADGMGGAAGGAVASRVAVETFTRRFPGLRGPVDARLRNCLDATTAALQERVRTDPDLDGMGCTVVAALYDGQELSWLSVGDSPMWLFADGRLERLNVDHSMAPVLRRMVETGELSAEEARRDSRRNMLRSAVTPEGPDLVDSAFRSCRLGPGDYLLIASDGLETLSEAKIAQALRAARDNPENAADSLFSAVRAADRPRQDNMTFLLLSGGSDPAGRAPPPGAGRRVARQWPGFAFGLAIGALVVAFGLWQFGAMSLQTGPDGQPGAAPATGPAVQPAGRTGSASETPRPGKANRPAAPGKAGTPAARPPAKPAGPAAKPPTRKPAAPRSRSKSGPADSPSADPALSPEGVPAKNRSKRPAPGGEANR